MADIDTSREAVERLAGTLTGHHIYGGSPLIAEVAATLRALLAERDDLQRTFELRWQADQRAIKAWQAAHPGRDLVWPNHADMVMWLMTEREKENLFFRANRFFQSVIRAANDWEQKFLAVSNERDRMREALLRIASPDYGLQAMIEDGIATPKNKAAYYEAQVKRRQNIAYDALNGGGDE